MMKKFGRIIPFSMLVLVFMALIVIAPTDFAPRIFFVEPTPPSGTTTSNTNVEINVSVEDASLTNLIYNWNNNSYSFYDSPLVLMFNFDNIASLGEGTLWGDKVKDLSLYNNDGILGKSQDGIPIWTINGKYNGAFTFKTLDFNTDGDSILVKHSDSLNPYGGDFAIMLWVNYGYSTDSDIMRKGSTGTASTWYKVEVGGYGTPNLISLNFNTDGTDATLEDSTDYSDNKWHFVVAQRRGNQAELWIDGVKKKSGAVSESISNVANLTIGSKDTQNDDFFNGTLDEFRIYMKSFTENEIKQFYISNLNEYDVNKWLLYVNQNNLANGFYTYFAYAKDSVGNENTTEIRNITIEVTCGDGYCDGSIGENCDTCSLDCISGQYAICGDGICHGTSLGETCNSCLSDCIKGTIPGGTCSSCFKGKCDNVCHPTKENLNCADCNPGVSYCCGDGVCNGNENIVSCAVDCGGSVPPVYNFCCGDDVCQGSENVNNCLYDCGCILNEECNDNNECTTNICNGGVCENNPLIDNTLCASGVCCSGQCVASICYSNLECNDGNSCTVDICNNAGTCSASCSNIWPNCGISDGCCGTSCNYLNDPDCKDCKACFKGKCDGVCNPSKEGLNCPDCI